MAEIYRDNDDSEDVTTLSGESKASVPTRLLEIKRLTSRDSDGNTLVHLSFYHVDRTLLLGHMRKIKKYYIHDNPKNRNGLSHFLVACALDDDQVMELILGHEGTAISDRVSTEADMYAGFTGLHFAAVFKSRKALELLLYHGADIRIENADKLTCLQLAIAESSTGAKDVFVSTLMQHDFIYRYKLSFRYACMQDDPNLVHKFINSDYVDVNTPIGDASNSRRTPLEIAVYSNNLNTAAFLLRRGARVITPNYTSTPLHYAFGLEYNGNRTSIVDEMFSAILQRREELDILRSRRDLTFLHVAITRNHLELVRSLLLDTSELINVALEVDTFRRTALHHAVMSGFREMTELLLNHGADLERNSKYGTALQVAIIFGHPDIIMLLLEKGSNPKVISEFEGKTTLHLLVERYVTMKKRCENLKGKAIAAIKEKNERLLPIITHLSTGRNYVDVNALDERRDTALHTACSQWVVGMSTCVKLLIQQGANINLANAQGEYPLRESLLRYLGHDSQYFKVIYYHVIVMKALNLANAYNVEWAKKLLRRRDELSRSNENSMDIRGLTDDSLSYLNLRLHTELSMLKSYELTRGTSIYDYIACDVADYTNRHRGTLYFQQTIIEQSDYENMFECFGYLIRIRWAEVYRHTFNQFSSQPKKK